jgi:hypothetical protein
MTGKPSVPTCYNITMTNINTEYGQALPAAIKELEFRCRDGTEFRFAFETGKVAAPTAPYATLPAAGSYWKELPGDGTQMTLYVACASAGKVVEAIAWI